MDLEKASIAIVCTLALFAVFVIGTSSVSGNAIGDAGGMTSPVIGLAILVVFIVAAVLVLKTMIPEGRYHG